MGICSVVMASGGHDQGLGHDEGAHDLACRREERGGLTGSPAPLVRRPVQGAAGGVVLAVATPDHEQLAGGNGDGGDGVGLAARLIGEAPPDQGGGGRGRVLHDGILEELWVCRVVSLDHREDDRGGVAGQWCGRGRFDRDACHCRRGRDGWWFRRGGARMRLWRNRPGWSGRGCRHGGLSRGKRRARWLWAGRHRRRPGRGGRGRRCPDRQVDIADEASHGGPVHAAQHDDGVDPRPLAHGERDGPHAIGAGTAAPNGRPVEGREQRVARCCAAAQPDGLTRRAGQGLAFRAALRGARPGDGQEEACKQAEPTDEGAPGRNLPRPSVAPRHVATPRPTWTAGGYRHAAEARRGRACARSGRRRRAHRAGRSAARCG